MVRTNRYICFILCFVILFFSSFNVYAKDSKDEEGLLNKVHDFFKSPFGQILEESGSMIMGEFVPMDILDWMEAIVFIENLPVDGNRSVEPGPNSLTAKLKKIAEAPKNMEEKYHKLLSNFTNLLSLFNDDNKNLDHFSDYNFEDERSIEIIKDIQNPNISIDDKISIVRDNIDEINRWSASYYAGKNIAKIKPGESVEAYNNSNGYMNIITAFPKSDYLIDVAHYDSDGNVVMVHRNITKRTFTGISKGSRVVITNKSDEEIYIKGEVLQMLNGKIGYYYTYFKPTKYDGIALNTIILNKGDKLVVKGEKNILMKIQGSCYINNMPRGTNTYFTKKVKPGELVEIVAREDNLIVYSGKEAFHPIIETKSSN